MTLSPQPKADKSEIATRPLERSDFPILESLFGVNGACGGCWCMLWRVPSLGAYWEQNKGKKNKSTFKKLVVSGEATGIIALANDQPAGWCSVGPKSKFPYLERARLIPTDPNPGAWAITCFFIAKDWQRRGVSMKLVEAALQYAKKQGALYIDGYPVRLKKDKEMPVAFVHTGLSNIFKKAGFRRTASAGARDIYRKNCDNRD